MEQIKKQLQQKYKQDNTQVDTLQLCKVLYNGFGISIEPSLLDNFLKTNEVEEEQDMILHLHIHLTKEKLSTIDNKVNEIIDYINRCITTHTINKYDYDYDIDLKG